MKGWLDAGVERDRANVAQAVLALANHGGGFVVIGIAQRDGDWSADPARPAAHQTFTQDVVNSIVARYAEPSFHCSVYLVPHPTTGVQHVVISVPGGRVPIRSRSEDPERRHVRVNKYYIRRPGPCSEEPQTAAEWDGLLSRCLRQNSDALLRDLMALISGPSTPLPTDLDRLTAFATSTRERLDHLAATQLPADEVPNRYARGVWSFSYALTGDFERPTARALLDTLRRVPGETGWPPWHIFTRDALRPRPQDGLIECWLAETNFAGDHSDFWRADPTGLLSMIRPHQEDFLTRITPGTVLDLALPIWRVGESVLHACKLARLLNVDADVAFLSRWDGLEGRQLASAVERTRYHPSPDGHAARQPSVTTTIRVNTRTIEADLTNIVNQLTRQLYEVFDFYEMPATIIQTDLDEMRNRRR